MIDVIEYEDGLPISVIVPLSKKRSDHFNNFTLPLIEANRPTEIIINDNEGNAPKKRNDGFDKSTQPYVFFCDDDILLPATHLEKLYKVIKENNIGFTYSGYVGFVHPRVNNHPIGHQFTIQTTEYDFNKLKRGNYISTMALIKRDLFVRFDEELKRLQDWDLFIRISCESGCCGKAVFNNEFYALYLDEGITSNNNNEQQAIMTIINKHNLSF